MFDQQLNLDDKYGYIGLTRVFLVLFGLYAWPNFTISGPAAWFACFVLGVVLTGVSYLADCVMGLYLYHIGNFWAGCRFGIGFAFTIICGLSTLVFFAGGVRTILLKQLEKKFR